MLGRTQIGIALAVLLPFMGLNYASAQEKAQAVEAGTFHGKVHKTSGRATIYKEADGRLVLRLTNFKTSNGPDVHVVLIAAKDADDDANFLKNSTDKLERTWLPVTVADCLVTDASKSAISRSVIRATGR